jgi:hypothetical protein
MQMPLVDGCSGEDVVQIVSLDEQQQQQQQHRRSRFGAAAAEFKQSMMRPAAGRSLFHRSSSVAGSTTSSRSRSSSVWRFGSRNSSRIASSAGGPSSGLGTPAGGLCYRTFDYPFSSPGLTDDTAFDAPNDQEASLDRCVLGTAPFHEQGGCPPTSAAAEVGSWSRKPWLLSSGRDASLRSCRPDSMRADSGPESNSKELTGMWFV